MVMTVTGKKKIRILNANEKNLSFLRENNWITISMEEKPSRKWAREVETKRLSDSEVNKVLDYMLEHKNVEVRACRILVLFVANI